MQAILEEKDKYIIDVEEQNRQLEDVVMVFKETQLKGD
jgi:hypothetical protein